MSFTERRTRLIRTVSLQGWQLKVYAITMRGPLPDAIVTAALAQLEPELPAVEAPGVRFVIIHDGEQAVWLLSNHWHDDIIFQGVYRADHADPTHFVPIPRGGPTTCLHELKIHCHEAQALIGHVLAPPEPDVPAYLADHFHLEPAERSFLAPRPRLPNTQSRTVTSVRPPESPARSPAHHAGRHRPASPEDAENKRGAIDRQNPKSTTPGQRSPKRARTRTGLRALRHRHRRRRRHRLSPHARVAIPTPIQDGFRRTIHRPRPTPTSASRLKRHDRTPAHLSLFPLLASPTPCRRRGRTQPR
jgi:hypothetical protein